MQKKKLSARHRLILTYMNGKHMAVPGRELAERLGVSTRTVRGEVARINDLLREDDIRIRSLSGKGYQLEVGDRPLFLELISDREIMQTKEDRIIFLMMRLINSDDWIELAQLEDEMFVSRTTLENDLREIRRRVCEHQPYIAMKRRNNAILIEDDEMKKREVLLHIYCDSWDFDSREGISLRNSPADRKVMDEIRTELVRALRENGIRLDDPGIVNMRLALALIYARNLEEHRMYNAGRCSRYGRSRKTVEVLLDRLKKQWEIELEEADYDWLTGRLDRLCVMSAGVESYESAAAGADEASLRAAEQLEDELWEKFGISFRDDETFRAELLISVRAFRNSDIPTQAQSRYSTDLLEKQYVMLGGAARYLAARLEEMTGFRLRKNANNWLVPMLCSAAERKERRTAAGIRTVIVSHYSLSLTRYLEENLRKLFGMRMKIIASVPVYDRRTVPALNPTLVITTVKMGMTEDIGVPCVVTSPIVTQDELILIDRTLQMLERASLHEPLPEPAEAYLDRGGAVAAGRSCSADEAVVLAVKKWVRQGLIHEEETPDAGEFVRTFLEDGRMFLYRTGHGDQTWVTTVSAGAILCGGLKNPGTVYVGSFAREASGLIPALFGALDHMKREED